MARPYAPQWKPATRLRGPAEGMRPLEWRLALTSFWAVVVGGLIVRPPSPPSAARRHFPQLGWGMGSARRDRAGPLKERGSAPSLAFLDVRGPRGSVVFAAERFWGPRLPGASLRSFPSPLSREPDLAAAIFPSPSSPRFCFQHFRFTSLVFFFHHCVDVFSDFPFFWDVFIPFRGGFSVLSLGLQRPAHLAKGSAFPSTKWRHCVLKPPRRGVGAGWRRSTSFTGTGRENVVQPRPGRVPEGSFAAERPF